MSERSEDVAHGHAAEGGPFVSRWRALLVPAGFALAAAVLLVAGRGALAPPPRSVRGFVDWAEARGTIAAACAMLRLAALVVAAWLAATTAVATLARAAGSVRLADRAERGMPESVRRAVAAAAGVGVASVVTLGGAAAGADPDQPAPTGEPLVLLPSEGEGTATMSVLPDEPSAPEPALVASAPPADPAPAQPARDEWFVAAGESFWSIAEEVVGETLGRSPADAEVAPYWRALVEANRDRLVTPDPDLVHPGQVFLLPPRPPASAQP